MANPLPEAEEICIELSDGPGELCIVLPGGARLCASANVEVGDSAAIFRAFLADMNAALTPLTPIFNIIDTVQAVLQCIEAIPKAITNLNPSELIDCIPNLREKVEALLQLLPTVAVPVMVKSILTAIIVGLVGLRDEMRSMIDQTVRIAVAGTRATDLGNIELQNLVDCAQANFDIQLTNLNASIAPLSRLIGLVNVFLKLAGIDCVRIPLDPFAEATEDALEPIDDAIDLLTTIRDAIPVPDLKLPPIPSKSDAC